MRLIMKLNGLNGQWPVRRSNVRAELHMTHKTAAQVAPHKFYLILTAGEQLSHTTPYICLVFRTQMIPNVADLSGPPDDFESSGELLLQTYTRAR